MARVKEVSSSSRTAPEDYLRLSLEATDGPSRARYARAGLALNDIAPDTQQLLLRQLYLAHLEARRFQRAADVARQMSAVGALRDIAHHDASRALAAVGDLEAAVVEQRMAARAAPAARRSFHLWSLATLLHFAGDTEGALRALKRAERWAQRDRSLIRAHAAYVRLDAGRGVEQLGDVLGDLRRSKNREGYGQYLLGMIAYLMDDHGKAAVHLRSFLRRNASADVAKTMTLREELRRARTALARLESV